MCPWTPWWRPRKSQSMTTTTISTLTSRTDLVPTTTTTTKTTPPGPSYFTRKQHQGVWENGIDNTLDYYLQCDTQISLAQNWAGKNFMCGLENTVLIWLIYVFYNLKSLCRVSYCITYSVSWRHWWWGQWTELRQQMERRQGQQPRYDHCFIFLTLQQTRAQSLPEPAEKSKASVGCGFSGGPNISTFDSEKVELFVVTIPVAASRIGHRSCRSTNHNSTTW